MPRRVSTSQFRSELQRAQNRLRQATQRYNSQVRQNNAERKRKIDSYNRAVRSYNSRLRANRSRLQTALQRLSRQPTIIHYTTVRHSSLVLSDAYERLDASSADPFLSDLAERETANSLSLVNTLIDENDQPLTTTSDLTESRLGDSLSDFSEDLQNRWAGALYALNPANPDAARHFCASTREIIAAILNAAAPDDNVSAEFPDCKKNGSWDTYPTSEDSLLP